MNNFQLLQKTLSGEWVVIASAEGRSMNDLPDFLSAYDSALDALDAKEISGIRVTRNGERLEEDVRS